MFMVKSKYQSRARPCRVLINSASGFGTSFGTLHEHVTMISINIPIGSGIGVGQEIISRVFTVPCKELYDLSACAFPASVCTIFCWRTNYIVNSYPNELSRG